jgi:potassium-transporting ATPase KdpC subunit
MSGFPEPSGDDRSDPWRLPPELRAQLRRAIAGVLWLTLLTGCLFPLGLFAVGRLLFAGRADGSLLKQDGVVVGSEFIGQNFTRPEYFQPRPSAAGNGYDGVASGGTNFGPFHHKLIEDARRLAVDYRERNGMPAAAAVPIDAVTRSGSGLDPHISPANAELQIARVARARGLDEGTVRTLVADYTRGPELGFMGSERVTVLELNLALDRAGPASTGSAPGPKR